MKAAPVFQTLRAKIITVFLLLMLIPMGATVIFGQVFTQEALSESALERSGYQVHLQTESIVSALRQAEGDSLYLSQLRSLGALLNSTNETDQLYWQDQTAQDFAVLLSVKPMYNRVRYLDSSGMEVIAAEADGSDVHTVTDLRNRASSRFFQEAMLLPPGEVYVSSFGLDQEAGEAQLPYIYYVLRAEGGVVIIDLHAGWLLRNLPGNPGADIWALVDQDGRYLVTPENFSQADVHDLAPILTGGTGSHQTEHSVILYDTVFPAGQARDYYWVVYRETPKSVLFKDLDAFYLAVALTGMGGLALTCFLAFITSRWLVGPIVALERMAAEFGAGGSAPEEPPSLARDEIGALTRTFCAMASELERKRNQEHRLIEQLIKAQEEERKLVAYDLHDGLIQQMVGARFYLTNCRTHCPIEASGQEIMKGCDALTEAIIEGRRIIEGLRPAVLDDLGLIAALEEVAHTTAQAAGWSLTLALETLPSEPEKTVSTTLYRITQEALNNARKHAKADNIRISLHNGKGISLSIEDNGCGFDPTEVMGEGLGVTTMHERAALVGGQCKISRAEAGGTRIDVWVPSDPAYAPNVPAF